MQEITRRQALLTALFGTGWIGLRALATGIPASILLNPRRALAADPESLATVDATAQYLVMARSGDGDPLNGNVPGTYDDPGIVHPTDPAFQPANINLGGNTVRGAQAWGQLSPALLGQTVFFHHATYMISHDQDGDTQRLGGAVAQNDMLTSALALQLAPRLNTVQAPPMCLTGRGGEPVTAEGRVQPVLTPSSLASVLTLPKGPLTNLQAIRDQTLNSLYKLQRETATAGQKGFLDRYANSQADLRKTAGSVLDNLSTIKDNGQDAQITAAVAAIQMNLSPAICVHLNFGGDNHGDNNLQGEANAQMQSVASINKLYTQLGSIGMADRVSFMAVNVFGRTMAVSHKGTTGRDHNANHHATVMIGAGLKGGVVGGVAPMQDDYGATAIDSESGKGDKNGDVAFGDTFAAMGKTIGRGVGVDADTMDKLIPTGKAIASALR